ncbi:flagellar biosynthesis anti-sigma factor FlgM [Halobacillus litoralis]|uniref:flagellar biosynthesis anti-sigma factor FlgM n=1 Tax=Halobacillus litoralis TaxID=45668 RepID=UPI001CFDF897|nr:flagellar biosynthesis anti-sigma factor FlgM [Halobacillus litoralis]
MKINRPNQASLNPYQKQWNNQAEVKSTKQSKDKLEISDQAKQMQESGPTDAARNKLVEKIKTDVQTGNYQVDSKRTAQKMIDFWSTKG